MRDLYNNIPPILKNFYFISFVGVLIWVLVFDKNDLITHIKLQKELNRVEEQLIFFKNKINEVEKDKNELEGNQELLEKYAREQYLMKKESEDIYIIENKENKSE